MNFGELLTDVYRDVGITSSPPTVVANRVKSNLNKAQRAILRDPGMSRLRDTLEPLTFASEASRYIYGLPTSVSILRSLTERDTDRKLWSMSLDELREIDPGFTATGTPSNFVPLGVRHIQEPPATTGIWVASADAADTTQTVLINGIRSGGLPTGDITATLNGATRVQLGTLTDYVDVQAISLSAVAAGVVSFFDAAVSGNTLAQIPIGQTVPHYFCIQLWPTPSAAVTYYVDGTLRGLDMDDNSDVPLIPEEFHDILADYARSREYEKMGDQRFAMAAQMFSDGLKRLRYYVSTLPAETPVLGRPMRRHVSRLGAWYPSESW